LVVIAAIYATLGPAGRLVGYLRERNLLRVSFALVVLLVVGVIARQWAKRHPSLGEIGVALGVTAVYLTVWIRIQSLEERTHLFEYGLVAVLIHQAFIERRRHSRRVPAPAALAVASTALLGWLDEGIQAILSNRVYDIRDVGFNALAGLMAVTASLVLFWARRRFGKAHTGGI
jgi:VanZ family protein